MFQIVGHSYDLDTENMWDKIEGVFKVVSSHDDILPMTTIDIIDYLKAMEKANITDSHIINNSSESLWFLVNGDIKEVKPESKIAITKQ